MTPVAVILACLVIVACASMAVRPVAMVDIKTLAFVAGDLVDRVRTPVQRAMQCAGGNACHDTMSQPSRALCTSQGVDDQGAIVWRCEFPGIPDGYDVPRFSVRCEGWAYAGDPMVRPGSCVLDYHYNRAAPPLPPPPVEDTTTTYFHVLPPPPPPHLRTSLPTSVDVFFLLGIVLMLVGVLGLIAMCTSCPCPSHAAGEYHEPRRSQRLAAAAPVFYAPPPLPMVIHHPPVLVHHVSPPVVVHHHHQSPPPTQYTSTVYARAVPPPTPASATSTRVSYGKTTSSD